MSESIALDHQLPGETIRQSREDAALSVEDLARVVKLSPQVIRALEVNDYDSLPSLLFVRGYLQNVQRALGLPGSAVVEKFDRWRGIEQPAQPERQARVLSDLEPSVEKKRRPWGVLLLVILLGGGIGYGYSQNFHADVINYFAPVTPEVTPITQTPEPLPVIEAPEKDAAQMIAEQNGEIELQGLEPVIEDESARIAATQRVLEEAAEEAPVQPVVSQPVVAEHQLIMRFSGESWVEVRDQDRSFLAGGLMTPAQTIDLTGEGPFSILVGNVSTTQVVFDGEVLDLTDRARQNVARIQLP